MCQFPKNFAAMPIFPNLKVLSRKKYDGSKVVSISWYCIFHQCCGARLYFNFIELSSCTRYISISGQYCLKKNIVVVENAKPSESIATLLPSCSSSSPVSSIMFATPRSLGLQTGKIRQFFKLALHSCLLALQARFHFFLNLVFAKFSVFS